MVGSLEKQIRATFWEMLRDLLKFPFLNGKGRWFGNNQTFRRSNDSPKPSEGFSEDVYQNHNFCFQQPSEGLISISISRFIQNIFNSYVQAVNFDMERKGTLFESKYKFIRIDKEEYLIQLVRYIHLNPVLAGLCNRPEDWQYSNCREWLGIRNGTLFDREFFDTFFQTFDQYREFLNAYQDYKMMQKELRKFVFDCE